MRLNNLTLNVLQNGITHLGLSLILCSLVISCGPKNTKNHDLRQKKTSASLAPKQQQAAPKAEPLPDNKLPTKGQVKPNEKPNATEATLPKISLTGIWQSPCMKGEGEDEGESEANIDEYVGVESRSVNLKYSGENCENLRYSLATRSTFTIGQASSKVPGAFDIDAKIVKIELTPASQDAADTLTTYFNDDNDPNCASIEFAANVAEDITTCAIFPKVHYDLVKLDGDQLNYGDCKDPEFCGTADKRPTTLSNVTYRKKSNGHKLMDIK